MLRRKLSSLLATSIRNFPVKNANPISHVVPKKTPSDEFLHCPNGILGSHFHGLLGRSYSALNNDNKGSRQQKTRKGRDIESGKGKIAGRGRKGQKARGAHKFGFEGFTNPFSLTFQPVGLGKIAKLINCGKIDPSAFASRARSPTTTPPVVRFPPFWSRGLPELKCSSSSSVYQVSGSFGLTRSFSVASSSWTLDSIETNSFKGDFGLVHSCNAIDGGGSVRSELVEIIKRGNEDMEYKLNLAGSVLRIVTITEIFQVLNHQKISGLRFFRWLRHNNPKWHSSAKVCSLIVSNCGCLGDFETMRLLLLEFRKEKICLDETAFTFLSFFTSSNDLMIESVRRVLSLLDEVGGSCRNSGIYALIEMFCNLCLFEMAKFVIEITERNNMHYNILLRHRCKRGHVEEARSIIKEMRCPTIKSYNYLLGSLCKNVVIDDVCSLVEDMEENGVHPDEITFEILIINSCVTGKLDIAKQLLNKMTEDGLLPRLSTHSAILKAFFKAEQYVEAHNYVVDSSIKCQQSGPAVYSLLAGLHLGKEHLTDARDILIQMMDMDLRPNFRVYVKTLKQLQKTGREDMAQELENRCKRGHVEEARSIIKEMRCPTIKSYNYLLGSLCKNVLIDDVCSLVEDMEENGVHPDEITFEILIINSCITGKLDIAKQLLNKMTEDGLLPRLSTHSAILKAFFKAEQYVEAHNYVIDSSIKCQQSGPAVYSLLAGLHLGKEHLTDARDILIQMMDMDLRPNFRVYVKTLKQL